MNTQDEIGNIVAELQRLQIQESQLLQRLDRLNELNSSNATVPPSTTRVFAIGDLVKIKKTKTSTSQTRYNHKDWRQQPHHSAS